ncbi:MAG: tRNA lysidine(34) synthetase TilS [Bacteroidales bacterium]|jgi:tRNA(Ile)-lysidine synthase|nr:tRNA lysidine(34) synthetase TilS [Bacteroidales bacterium]
MLGEFINFLNNHLPSEGTDRFLLAVSGGIDSMVMTHLFHRAGFQFDLAHANFQLRGKESGRDEQFVRDLAGKYRVKLYVKHFDTVHYAVTNKVSVQVAARQLRYAWFDELWLKHGYSYVATAHHLDDQVETFLINMARGTGIAGLHGIPVRQGNIIRPMLFTDRIEIEKYARDNQLEFVTDSSNLSDKYTRNRIRHKIIPQLEKINPAFRKTISDSIGWIRDVESVYRQAIDEKRREIFRVERDAVSIPVSVFFNLTPLQTFAFELLSPYGFNMSNINDIIRLKEAIPGKEIQSPTHRLVRDRELLIIVPRRDLADKPEYEITAADIPEGIKSPIRLTFEVVDNRPGHIRNPRNIALLDLEKLVLPLRLRKWKRGDFFYPLGMSQPKKLSDFFIDRKFSKIEKEHQWLLCSGDDIVWVIGQRIDDRYKVGPGITRILRIEYCQSD